MEIVSEILDVLGVLALFSIGAISIERLMASNQSLITRQISSGLIIGLMIVVAVIDPIKISEGATFDPRGGPAILAGVFAGPIGAIIAAIMGSLARMYIIGGPYALGGVVGFALYGVFGVLAGVLIKRKRWRTGPLTYVILGLGGTLFVLPAFFINADIPTGIIILEKAGLLLLVNNLLGCMLVGFVFYQSKVWAGLRNKLDEEQNKTLLLSRIADETTNAVIITDKAGLIEWVNAGFEKISEYSLAEVLGRKPGEVLQKDDVDPLVKEHMSSCIAQVKPFNVNVLNYSKSGNPYRIDISCQPFVSPDGKTRFMAIETDATERVLNQENLERAKEDAESANKAKSEFLSAMSHELRTPLTSSIGGLGLIKSSFSNELSVQGKELLAIALRNNESLLRFVNELLDYDKILSGTLVIETQECDICELITRSITNIQSYAQSKSINFVFNKSTVPLYAKIQEHRFEQVLQNLLSNAVKFSDSKSDVDIFAEANAENIVVEVRDYGVGILEEFKPKVFERFTQADSSTTRKYGGTGLGLSISKALTEAMGGSLEFESEIGVGSTFIITLPVPK